MPNPETGEHHPTIIIGGGPAGLSAAYEFVTRGIRPLVLEKGARVGGLARTEIYRGYHFDIGGHRFYTKVDEIQRLWQKMVPSEFLLVPRLSRIYYRGRFFHYPIDLPNTLYNLGLIESLLTLVSYLQSKLFPYPREDTFEQWVSNRFGRRLFRTFFKTYTEKVWGIPCNIIQADWASQRIRGLSLAVAVSDALWRTNGVKTLINEFNYPSLGPGMMWEQFQHAVERDGGQVELESEVVRLCHQDHRVAQVVVQRGGEHRVMTGDHFLSSMPIGELVRRLDPPAPVEVLDAANRLHYRAFILVALIVNRAGLFPDNWLYVHNPEVRVGRIQNFKNWSRRMVPDEHTSSLGMEYFCDEGDALWNLEDRGLIVLGCEELETLGLARAEEVKDGIVIRQPQAYPVYDPGYRERLQVIRRFLDTFENLQTLGRNGMHRYNNLDHAMLTGIRAARNVMGEKHDLWEINTEPSYDEDFGEDKTQRGSSGRTGAQGKEKPRIGWR